MSESRDEEIRKFLALNIKPFGQTGWEIPLISFGGASLSGEGGGYGFGNVSKEQGKSLVDYALDLGINLFDTAPIYGFGLSEQRLGEFLKSRREKVYITTKSGVTWNSSKRVDMTNDPKVAENMLLQSLKDLATDYIDLYFIHWPDSKIDIRKPLEVLAKYQLKGVIKKIGLCNTNLEDLQKAKEIVRVDVIQSEYNLFQRKVEAEIFSYCQKNNCAFMSWGPLDKGALTGNYDLKRTYDDSDARKSAPWFKKSDLEKKVLIVEKMKALLPKDITMMEMVNSFYMNQPVLSTILAGSKSVEQFRSFGASMLKGAELWKNFSKREDFLKIAGQWNS